MWACFFLSFFFLSSFSPVFCVPVRLDNVLQLKLMFALILVPSSNWPSHSWLDCICLGWQLCFSGFPRFSGINGIVWIGRLITYWPDWPSDCESVCCISGGTAHVAHNWMIHASISVQVKAVTYTACSGLWCYLECIKRSHRRVNQSCLETIIFSPSPCCPSPLLFSSSVLSPPSCCFFYITLWNSLFLSVEYSFLPS